jgi:hypothetical protein
MLQSPWLSAHFVTRPIFVSPSAPTSGFHRLPPLASIGTSAPPAVPPCYALPTTSLLHARRAKPKRRHATFTSPTESVPSRLLFPL